MLFGKTVAVYCENRTELTDTLCGQNAEINDIKINCRYIYHETKKTKLRGLSPRANYTDRATAACRRS
jgi:hypothetical protein